MMEVRELSQKSQMMLAPGDDIVEVIAGRDRGAGHQQQDLLEGIHNAPGLAVVLELGKVLQKQTKTRTRDLSVEDRVHDGAPPRIKSAHGITTASSTQNYADQPVNLSSEPWIILRHRLP
jgi:hypothetical protein